MGFLLGSDVLLRLNFHGEVDKILEINIIK